MGYMEWWMILLSHPVHSWDKSSHWLVLSTMWGEWRKPTKREARGCLKIEDRRMRIKKGETKYRGMKDSGMEVRERERGDLHLHLHLHTPQQASSSQPGHHGTFPVTGGGSKPHIALNQSDCCNLRNRHFPAGSSCSQMRCAKQGLWEITFHMPSIPQFKVVIVKSMQFSCREV